MSERRPPDRPFADSLANEKGTEGCPTVSRPPDGPCQTRPTYSVTSTQGSPTPRYGWVNPDKALDYPHLDIVGEDDPDVAAWLASLSPADRAEHEARVLAGRADDPQARLDAQAIARVGLALGADATTPQDLDAILRRCPRFQGLAFAGLRYELAPGAHTTRGPLLLTALPALALSSGPPARGGSTVPPLLFVVFVTGGRDASAVATRPAEVPIVLPAGTPLEVLGRRDIAGQSVELAVDRSDPTDPRVGQSAWLWNAADTALHAGRHTPVPVHAATDHYLGGSLP